MDHNFEPINDQNKDESIQVVIRIKPTINQITEQQIQKCAFLSPNQQNTIVVQTQNKKEYFSFDHIASQNTQQSQIFQKVGNPILIQSLKGFNCCIFAYGQTGAGKTYSILGNSSQIFEDNYTESRGILPRLLESLFEKIQQSDYKNCQVKCSYLQIYNEQIIDLLNKQVKTYQIREDYKKGVYVDGIIENKINSYTEGIEFIFKGLKNRKIASTAMNSQSSRSHTIFTVTLKFEEQSQGLLKSRFSKIHIVDLAGSERTKLAKVGGDRLKQGCNINKSLHALGNVINSLVQSMKKKKYIPFRDSKLTYLLKDSIGGNSKTTLLANINPKKNYIGDTISTLMFAKRAKIIKNRIEQNQNIGGQNVQSLRKQIKKLRQQLAQTKFIKKIDATQIIQKQQIEEIIQKQQKKKKKIKLINQQKTVYGGSEVQCKLKTFQENQTNYRLIIQLYEQRLKNQPSKIQKLDNVKIKQLYEIKKKLQKQCSAYSVLIGNVKPFTKIFHENLELKNKVKCLQIKQRQIRDRIEQSEIELQNLKYKSQQLENQIDTIRNQNKQLKLINEENEIIIQNMKHDQAQIYQQSENQKINEFKQIIQKQNSLLEQYETNIEELKENFQSYKQQLIESYEQLEQQLQMEKNLRNQMRRQKRYQIQPDLQIHQNENQYLKLNILELETQIKQLQKNMFQKDIQLKINQQEIQRLNIQINKYQDASQIALQQLQLNNIIQKLKLIQQQALIENNQIQNQLNKQQQALNLINQKLNQITIQNYQLISKNQNLLNINQALKIKINRLQKGVQIQMYENLNTKSSMCWTAQDSADQYMIQKTPNSDLIKQIVKRTSEKDNLTYKLQQLEQRNMQDRTRMEKYYNKNMLLSDKITKLNEQINILENQNSILTEKIENIRIIQQEINKKRILLQKYEKLKEQIFNHSGKQIIQIYEQYKLLIHRNQELNKQNQKLTNQLIQNQKINNHTQFPFIPKNIFSKSNFESQLETTRNTNFFSFEDSKETSRKQEHLLKKRDLSHKKKIQNIEVKSLKSKDMKDGITVKKQQKHFKISKKK